MATAAEVRSSTLSGENGVDERPVNTTSRRSAPEPPVDRLAAIWFYKFRIVLAAVVVAGLTYLVTMIVPATYSSSVQVGLSAAPSLGSSAGDLAVAGNDLAAQYAQLVLSESVLKPAAASVGTSSAELRAHTTSGTLASQNIIEVKVQARTAAAAESGADAIANSLTDRVRESGLAATKEYNAAVDDQLAPLDKQISQAQKRVDAANTKLSNVKKKTTPQAVAATSAQLNSAQSLLTALTDRRASLATQATVQSISLGATAQILGGSTGGTKIEPRPALYTLIGGLVGLVLAAQGAVMIAERRRRP